MLPQAEVLSGINYPKRLATLTVQKVLKRVEVKAFLKEYYNGVSSLADRETYTFWEHYFHASPHKTHEEGWFLMRSRWMLYLEDKDTLNLLHGVPRAWLEQGKQINISCMATYYGPLFLNVQSDIDNGIISIWVKLDAPQERMPKTVNIRIPHPYMEKPKSVSTGIYCSEKETLAISDFSGTLNLRLEF